MKHIFNRAKWNILLYNLSPMLMTIISIWCYYFVFYFSEDDPIFPIYFAGLISVIFIYLLYIIFYKNPAEIIIKDQNIEFNYIVGQRIFFWDDVYEIVLSANRQKIVSLKIFFIRDDKYLSQLINIGHFTGTEELINKIRNITVQKDINMTEVLIKELAGNIDDRRIVPEIDFQKLSVEYSRNHEIFNKKMSKFDIIINLIPIAFFVFLFITSARISLPFSLIFTGFISLIALIFYTRGYGFFDSLFHGLLIIPAIVFIYGGPVALLISYFFE